MMCYCTTSLRILRYFLASNNIDESTSLQCLVFPVAGIQGVANCDRIH